MDPTLLREIESEVRTKIREQDLPPPKYKPVDPKLKQSTSSAAVAVMPPKNGINNPDQRPYSTGSNMANNPNNTQNRSLRSKLIGAHFAYSLLFHDDLLFLF